MRLCRGLRAQDASLNSWLPSSPCCPSLLTWALGLPSQHSFLLLLTPKLPHSLLISRPLHVLSLPDPLPTIPQIGPDPCLSFPVSKWQWARTPSPTS